MSLELDRLDGGHADVFQAFEVREVALTEGHEEADTLDARDIERQRLDFLMMQEVHVAVADLREIIDALNLHRLCFDPAAVLPVAALCGDFADVDLRIEVGGKGVAVVAGVAVEDVDILDGVEVVL